MPISDCEVRDPRMRRTRQLLQNALHNLLQEKGLDEILVQDITDAATVNRATFYDHYTDKFALFDAMVAGGFHRMLLERNIRFDGNCSSVFNVIVSTVCDYFIETHSGPGDCTRHRATDPLIEAAITSAVRRVLLDGLAKQKFSLSLPPEMIANTMSWAICGAVKEWFNTPNHPSAEEIVPGIVQLLLPLLEGSGVHSAKSAS